MDEIIDGTPGDTSAPVTTSAPTPLRDNTVSPDAPEERETMVIGGDERRQVIKTDSNPYQLICQIYMQMDPSKPGGAAGTGFLISPTAIVTAGHNLFDLDTKRWFQQFTIIPGRSVRGGQDFQPFGNRVVKLSKNVTAATKWVNNQDRNYDFGVIVLPQAQAFNMGINFFSVGNTQPGVPAGDWTLAGYPAKDATKPYGTMWSAIGKIESQTGNLLYHKIDGTEGQSGAPLIATRGNGTLGNVIEAMHIAEDSKTGRNVALAFPQSTVNAIMQWASLVG